MYKENRLHQRLSVQQGTKSGLQDNIEISRTHGRVTTADTVVPLNKCANFQIPER